LAKYYFGKKEIVSNFFIREKNILVENGGVKSNENLILIEKNQTNENEMDIHEAVERGENENV
jgi:hypothetical protein